MLTIDDTLLIVTDIQGKLASLMHNREELYRTAAIMVQGARELDIPILWIEQYPKGLGPTVPEVAEHLDGLAPMEKRTFSSLRDAEIAKQFDTAARKKVILIGIETHVCICQTALDLISRGCEVHVVHDAVSSRSPEDRDTALARISLAGGIITSAEMALFELLGTSEHPSFKAVSKLVK